jgi:hypothetical protein
MPTPRAYEKAIVKDVPQQDEVKTKSYAPAVVSPAGNKFGEDMPPGSLDNVIEDAGVAALQGGTAQYADDALDLVDPKLGDAVREAQKTGQERSPVTSFIAETAGEQANPLLRAGSLRKNFLATIAKVFGSSEDKLSLDTATSAGVAGLVDLGADILLKNLKIPFANEPKTLRSRVAGASTTEFKDIGINDRETVAENAHKMNLFTGRPVEFDLDDLKFKRAKSEPLLLEKPTSQVLQARAKKAVDKMKREYDFIVGVADKSAIQIPAKDLVTAIEQTFAQYAQGARGRKRLAELEPHLEDLYEDVLTLIPGNMSHAQRRSLGVPPIIDPKTVQGNVSLKKLAEWKSHLQDEATYGKDSLLKDIPYIEDFYADLAYKVNQVIQMNVPGQTKRLQDLGRGMHDLLIVQRDLKHKIARQKATGLVNPPSLLQGRQGSYYAQKFLESLPLGSTDEGLLNRAAVQEVAGKVKDAAPEAVQFLRQGLEGVPREFGKAMSPKEGDPGRAPQSIPNIPEMLLKAKIPRTTEAVLKNQKVVLAKIAQQDPTGNFYHMFKEMIEERPDELPQFLPKMIQMSPQFFEADPYQRVDNKILDQNLKLKAINDTMRREDLTSTEKIEIIDNLNRTGEFLDYKKE